MELALSLGDTPKPILLAGQSKSQQLKMKEVGFCMGLESSGQNQDHQQKNCSEKADDDKINYSSSSDPPKLQLDLLPFSPSHQAPPPPTHRPFPWLSQICKSNFLYLVEFPEFWFSSCYLFIILSVKSNHYFYTGHNFHRDKKKPWFHIFVSTVRKA